MRVCIIGTGFVGVVTSAVLASFGHEVFGLDIDAKKVASLSQGKVPFFEPNLENLLQEQLKAGNLKFTTSYQEAISDTQVIMIAVGTPSAANGQADLTYVLKAASALAPYLMRNAIVVVKSTVPPGTLEKVRAAIAQETDVQFYLASLPEFLREGSAVEDTLHPDRVIIGANESFVFETLSELHKPLNAPIIQTKPESAQMAKYAANAYLATRITYANQIADLCDKNGADVEEVIAAMGMDKRIGKHYWYPGFGYGGSCFPKDVKELAAYSRAIGEGNNLFNKIDELNELRIPKLLTNFGEEIGGWQGKKVAVLGLAFKPNTDDMREAPSLRTIPFLLKAGAQVSAYDPRALDAAKNILDKDDNLSFHDEIETACQNCDVIIALIEWPQVVSFDYSQVKGKHEQWFIDSRNQFDMNQIASMGYKYIGIGRSN